MKKAEIVEALARDPETVFALRPGEYDHEPTYIRGVGITVKGNGVVTVSSQERRRGDGRWEGWSATSPLGLIWSVGEVDAEFARRRTDRDKQAASRLRKDRVIAGALGRLAAAGVSARRVGDGVGLTVAAVDQLLAPTAARGTAGQWRDEWAAVVRWSEAIVWMQKRALEGGSESAGFHDESEFSQGLYSALFRLSWATEVGQ